jgi:hypothetical protein
MKNRQGTTALVPVAIPAFNYAPLGDEAGNLRQMAERIRGRNRTIAETIIETGKDLLVVKDSRAKKDSGAPERLF